ncbi:exonuclease domain-containing protein [Actinacidiphila rubida]|uniref:DNA polymerase-3 subunit epsilon n=1 Tax=Actinacidiphila rubida TaxID=310780 RepID=A0A1H8SW85_9ACTN|nr:exonuclease domain-containing protein [Actinacidiphila rubida]SEO82931.1 DNA polymerase-3 subunit epsilon [Actinacidiphila rubida]
MSWHTDPMLALDTESTGIDIETVRVVSAAVIHVSRDGAIPTTWLSDVDGQEIPAEASAVHGISTEHARAHGRPAKAVTDEVVSALRDAVSVGLPIVGHNVVYDLSLIDREARRHLGHGLGDALPLDEMRVIDTRVLDQHVLPRRRRVSPTQGPRQLITVAAVYSLAWDEEAAHGSEYDALMAARVAYRIGSLIEMPREQRPQFELGRYQQFEQLRGLDINELHARQVVMAKEQAAGLQAHFRKTDPQAVVDGRWPLIPFAGTAVTA